MTAAQHLGVGITIARWGSWPQYTSLLFRTIAHNPRLDFHILSDVPFPQYHNLFSANNLFYHNVTQKRFLEMLNEATGSSLSSMALGGYSSDGSAVGFQMSGSKISDVKPLFGEVLHKILEPYAYWGFLQEDVLIGNLEACMTPLLGKVDIVSPFGTFRGLPLNSSGVFMLFRNAPYVNRLWRLSADIAKVLVEPKYLIWDEWWGKLADPFPRVIGREVDAGRLKLHLAGLRPIYREDAPPLRLFKDDMGIHKHMKKYPALAACWRSKLGPFSPALFITTGSHYERFPCLNGFPGSSTPGAADEYCLLHFVYLKHSTDFSMIPISDSFEQATVQAAPYFAVTPEGLWLPRITILGMPNKTTQAMAIHRGRRAPVLLSGLAPGRLLDFSDLVFDKYLRGRLERPMLQINNTPYSL
mmetsp:Transcript_32888/g.54324  ORF Transcript_32888/g.54324 Transcript_32888/m.54324 type:complete len:414 (+) Transcript_32888:58-1299(+)|eukprot:CAMPEP_0119307320 /NCGR_PEP_ID=MMETSP1333-20130426/7859_1 /TAXON_ID=418940 /ORGANISM="Scyphosphaera apsteinii, Strain RCC1455" /LENGTH=413 /DNA_ID=CAMNT_0007310849 /DNA_START=49 /DNA_END=1290 /DNA_ORIENTATION=-